MVMMEEVEERIRLTFLQLMGKRRWAVLGNALWRALDAAQLGAARAWFREESAETALSLEPEFTGLLCKGFWK